MVLGSTSTPPSPSATVYWIGESGFEWQSFTYRGREGIGETRIPSEAGCTINMLGKTRNKHLDAGGHRVGKVGESEQEFRHLGLLHGARRRGVGQWLSR